MITMLILQGYTGANKKKRGCLLMWVKVAILVLLAAVVCSLFSGLLFLVKDSDNRGGRLVKALTLRITLTVLLMALIAYGFWSGELNWGAPWLH
jgi:membrane-anchored glycerophosphoryl diester phosphodiesterase (GDPDase)|tara:strand:+ start:5154 stop:5435 length:282 start_codon:yes stop_codon:yes gene_type:complete